MKQIISSILCGSCQQEFDVSTEDIEWEHLSSAEENSNSVKDFGCIQKVVCPHCNHECSIAVHCEGIDLLHITKISVIGL